MSAAETTTPVSGLLIARTQLGHATTALWRTQVVLIFTFAMPLVWLILIGLLAGNEEIGDDGVRVMQFAAPTAIAMGTFFATMPPVAITIAESRETGVLKRLRGTPLPAWCYFFGQIGAACVFAFASLAITAAVSIGFYGVQLQATTVPAMIVTLVTGVASFAAVGVAIGSLSRTAAVAEAVAIGSAVVLSFISGLFLIGGDLPVWLDRVASVFPLKPYAVSLQDQFNPYLDQGGDLGGLSVIAAWGVLGTLVSLRAFRWDSSRSRAPASDGAPVTSRRTGTDWSVSTVKRPSGIALISGQTLAALRLVIRRPGDVFFALAIPIGLFALLVTVQGNSTLANGRTVALTTAASMVTWGAGVAVFMNLSESVARARDTRVLKRLRGTPLPARAFLAGKTLAGAAVVTALFVAILAVGGVAFGLRITPLGLLTGFGIVLLGTGCFAACGFLLTALVPSARAVGAVGLIILFTLAFFSDVFITAGPEWMSTVGALFPLKHLQNGLATAWASGGAEFPVANVLVLLAWGVIAGWAAVWRFRWEPAV